MTVGKTNPWIIGALSLGAAFVLYILYQENQTAAANAANAAQQNDLNATATGSANGIVQSLIPDQIQTTQPGYPPTATVTSTGSVSEVNTAPTPVNMAIPEGTSKIEFSLGPNL
jgi:hypothetical protein